MTEITIPKTGVMKTGVIGLGAMGLQMARHMAAKGFEVYGADIDQDARAPRIGPWRAFVRFGGRGRRAGGDHRRDGCDRCPGRGCHSH